MMARKSQVDIVISCKGGAEVVGPAISIGVLVLGSEGSRGTEDAGAMGNGVVIEDAGT